MPSLKTDNHGVSALQHAGGSLRRAYSFCSNPVLIIPIRILVTKMPQTVTIDISISTDVGRVVACQITRVDGMHQALPGCSRHSCHCSSKPRVPAITTTALWRETACIRNGSLCHHKVKNNPVSLSVSVYSSSYSVTPAINYKFFLCIVRLL